MSASIRRSLAAVAATSCTLGLLALAFMPSTSAPAAPKPVAEPVKTRTVIVIPGSDQVSNTIDASDCPRLKADTVDGHPMGVDPALPYSLLLASPLAAAEYAVSGMTGTARLYGC